MIFHKTISNILQVYKRGTNLLQVGYKVYLLLEWNILIFYDSYRIKATSVTEDRLTLHASRFVKIALLCFPLSFILTGFLWKGTIWSSIFSKNIQINEDRNESRLSIIYDKLGARLRGSVVCKNTSSPDSVLNLFVLFATSSTPPGTSIRRVRDKTWLNIN